MNRESVSIFLSITTSSPLQVVHKKLYLNHFKHFLRADYYFHAFQVVLAFLNYVSYISHNSLYSQGQDILGV